MASKTITNAQREAAVAAAVAKAFGPRIAALEERHRQLGDAIYQAVWGATEAQAAAMPGGWVGSQSTIYVESDDLISSYQFNREQHQAGLASAPSAELPLSRERLFPKHVGAFNERIKAAVTAEAKTIHKLSIDWQRCFKERGELRASLTQLLGSVRTFKQLETVWPEGRGFWPKSVEPQPPRELAPADLIANVNKALGLAAAA